MLDADSAKELEERVRAFGQGAEDVVNGVLHAEAGPLIYERINPLIHPSGRRFKGHPASAKSSKWPVYRTNENLAVTVGTARRFSYLYFPNDGVNTKRHAGEQHFMFRGARDASRSVMERCIAALTRELDH
ncbi:hypothetical protein [Adlercreutzia mucosicola]|uniref:hypothetical protein n=1 Tax=Adlercreutzia mucosicola TaxID=580026 RepID=UPI0012EC5CF5|nr:hypothetical protein [Adlercreutzia mucosicola]MCR2034150.1 hypothetical protein [Adlercreutzia mucosicola]